MTFSTYNPNERYRQRSARRTSNVIAFLFLFSIFGGIGYWGGGIGAQQQISILREEKRLLMDENNKIQEEKIELRAEAQTASVRLEQLRASYEELLSDGTLRDIVTLVRQQIEQGVDVNRLESVILSARPPQNCSEADSKRFVVLTPVYKGPESRALIEGGIVIFGNGVPAKSEDGKSEAWFDPAQPVEITFRTQAGKVEVKKGVLPIRNSMVVRDKEYRFTVSVGAKSFAKVTYDYCDYP
ncbi:MAG: hypothetical protein GC137_09880 [Alphaproteobacteria bacterium]|nr:hypothetical protein [Alphaproteobacteria bacterium]